MNMAKKGKTVNRMKQYQALLDLCGGMSIKDVSERYEILPSTLHGWLRDPTIDAMYTEAQQKIFSAGIDILTRAVGKAAMKVVGVLDDPYTDHNTKLRAAELVFKYGGSIKTVLSDDDMIKQLTARGYNVSIDAESMVKQLQSKGVPVAMIEAGGDETDQIQHAITIIESDMLNL